MNNFKLKEGNKFLFFSNNVSVWPNKEMVELFVTKYAASLDEKDQQVVKDFHDLISGENSFSLPIKWTLQPQRKEDNKKINKNKATSIEEFKEHIDKIILILSKYENSMEKISKLAKTILPNTHTMIPSHSGTTSLENNFIYYNSKLSISFMKNIKKLLKNNQIEFVDIVENLSENKAYIVYLNAQKKWFTEKNQTNSTSFVDATLFSTQELAKKRMGQVKAKDPIYVGVDIKIDYSLVINPNKVEIDNDLKDILAQAEKEEIKNNLDNVSVKIKKSSML